jgi:hypothetical protein
VSLPAYLRGTLPAHVKFYVPMHFARVACDYRSVAAYATKYARNSSCLGRNLLWCCQRYSWSLDDIFHGYGNDFVYRSCNAQIQDVHLLASEFLCELILIRNGSFLLPSNMRRDEIDNIITYLCTC